MHYNTKVIFIILVGCSWLLVLYYNYEEVLLSACAAPERPQPIIIQQPISHKISTPNITNIGFTFVILVHNLKTIKTALVTIEIMQNPKNSFVVHIDRKVPASDADLLGTTVKSRDFKNVKIYSTQSIKWGGRELLPAAIDGISTALETWPDWHYMFLMSGDCLPIKSTEEIQKYMVKYWPKNSLSIYRDDVADRNQVGTVKKLRFKLENGEKFDDFVKGLEMVYYGTTWVTLTRPFVSWTMTDSFARNFLLYISAIHTDMDPETGFPSILEESYYQTLIMHSPFKDTMATGDECVRFEKWGGCNYMHEDRAVPCMLGDKDKSEMDGTDCIFARKFVYKELPEFIKKQIASY